MSERSATVQRRDLRRAIGTSAVGVVDTCVSDIHVLQLHLDQLEQKHDAVAERQWDVLARLGLPGGRIGITHVSPLDTLWHATSFWARLRWLLTGR